MDRNFSAGLGQAAPTADVGADLLAGKNIRKSFGARSVLHGIDVTLQPGQITAVIGPSGSGKSTLLRALSLLDPPDSGTVIVDACRYSFPLANGNGIRPPWPKLTLVFQQLFLWPHLTLMRNLTLPLENHGNGVSPSELEELIALFELKELMHRFPNEVSVGQRQKVALVRALALRPKYLLLDEITSALDVEHVSRILEHLQNLRARETGILLVTHLIGFARSAAHEVVFMEDGRVVERGEPSILDTPSTDRLRKFLSLVNMAR